MLGGRGRSPNLRRRNFRAAVLSPFVSQKLQPDNELTIERDDRHLPPEPRRIWSTSRPFSASQHLRKARTQPRESAFDLWDSGGSIAEHDARSSRLLVGES